MAQVFFAQVGGTALLGVMALVGSRELRPGDGGMAQAGG